MFDSLKGIVATTTSYSGGYYLKFQSSVGMKTESFAYQPSSDGSITTALQENGSTLKFDDNEGLYELDMADGSTAIYNPLPYISNNYYSDSSGSTSAGLIVSLNRPDGERPTYYYKTVGITIYDKALTTSVLNSVVSSAGWMMKYGYSSTTQALTSVTAINLSVDYCDPTADSCTNLSRSWPVVTFQDVGNGFTETDALGQPTSYTRTGNPYGPTSVFTIASPLGIARTANMHVLQVHNRSNSSYIPDLSVYAMVVTSVSRGNSVWNYTYTWGNAPGSTPPNGNDSGYTIVIDATKVRDLLGNTRSIFTDYGDPQSVVYSPSGFIFSLSYADIGGDTDALNRSTTYSRDPYGSVTSVYLPEGSFLDGSDSANYTYDARGNVTALKKIPKAGSGLAALTETAGYDATCNNPVTFNKPNYTIDARGNRADFTYDPVHGGMLTQTGPADTNGVRPQTRYASAQLTPLMKNAAGALINSTPVWKLVRTSVCASATSSDPASCVGTAAETVTTYAYDTANLLPTAVTVAAGYGSATRTTTKDYDAVGNVVSVDGPRTDVDDRSFATYDALRRPVFELGIDPDGPGPLPRLVTHHPYDADGHEYRTETGTGTALDGSDFVTTQYVARNYDAVTGLLVKTLVGAP